MKSYTRRPALALLLLLLLISTSCPSQTNAGYNSYQKNTFTAAGTGAAIKQSQLSLYHSLQWTTSGTVTSCSIAMDTSTDGLSWTAGGLISAQSCSTNGSYSVSGTANYVRMNLLVLTGGGTLTAVYKGYPQGLTNPSFSFSIPSPSVGDSGQYQHKLSTNAAIVRLSCSTDQGTVTVNIDFRAEGSPNTDSGTHVKTSDVVCSSSTTTTSNFDSPNYTAYQPIALIVTATSGAPTVLRVHVVMVPQ